MPNWADGIIMVRGTSIDDLRSFILRFPIPKREKVLYESGQDDDYKYFARSFIDVYENIDILNIFNSIKEDEDKYGNKNYVVEFNVQFAWSASTCIFDIKGSCLRNDDGTRDEKLITLEEACIFHNVSVEIFTQETGNLFEEHYWVDNKGQILAQEVKDIEYVEDEFGDTVVRGGFSNDNVFDFNV